MSISLGVDPGGTYTDAVLIRDEQTVLASAKSLTTRQDLALGIGRAVRAVLESAELDPADVALASLSTTLATNALVEGQGGRVALIYIGFRASDLEAHGLNAALKGDPALVLSGFEPTKALRGDRHRTSHIGRLRQGLWLNYRKIL